MPRNQDPTRRTPADPTPMPAAAGDLTGRYIVLLREDAGSEALSALANTLGARVASTDDGGIRALEDSGADGLVFPEIGAAVLSLDPDQARALGAASDDATSSMILASEPERVVVAIDDQGMPAGGPGSVPGTGRDAALTEFSPISDADIAGLIQTTEPAPAPGRGSASLDYLLGYRDSVNALVDSLAGRRAPSGAGAEAGIEALVWSETFFTWGLQATRGARSRFTGRGIRLAVLDTGFGPHQDFATRGVVRASFIAGETPDDGHGHGTHVMGTAGGPARPRVNPRYGMATEAALFSGKVLSNRGSGGDAGILNGINWAVANGCRVVNMSLGAPVNPGQPFSAVYEGVAARALQRGTLIIAAAGNDTVRPVSHPANCPSIMAVAALTDQLQRAAFSNRGINPNGGAVDIAGPGVNVHSAWPLAPFYRRLNGTSMATPHVAGAAAMWAQATGRSGLALWHALRATVRPLGLPAVDVGAGLVQAPL